MYEVKFSAQATKFFRSLEHDIQARVKAKLNEVALDPFRFLEHFEGDYHKLRIGDLRALIDVDQQSRVLWIRVLDKRGRIYK